MHFGFRLVSGLILTVGLAYPVDFEKEVYPVLKRSCFGCHGPKMQMAQLRLDAKATFLKGGKSGAVVTPGRSAESAMVKRIEGAPGLMAMPPAGERLNAEQIALVRAWIDEGAKWPDGFGADANSKKAHWSYVKPVRPAIPQVKLPAWVRNPIDAFLLARLEKEGLAPSPEAPKQVLIRRLSFDLTGLPPTPEEVDRFLADNSANAYEKVVDRLLASPHYGERWANMWLDLARYADTNGYESDEPRIQWAWRDWVIDAFNRNLPYDRFTIEQIAGDLLPNATEEQKIATGFHRNTLINSEAGSKDDEFRDAAVKDRVETTGAVWLGSTIGCAQCHNHKFDPFTQKDFYNMYAIFNNTAESSIDLTEMLKVYKGDADELRRRKAALEPLAKVLATQTPELSAAQAKWEARYKERLPVLDAAWKQLGSFKAEQSTFVSDLNTVTAIRVDGDPRPASLELQVWTSEQLAQQKRWMASQPQWGSWNELGPFEAMTVNEAFETAYLKPDHIDLTKAKKRPEWKDGVKHQLEGYNAATYLYRTIDASAAGFQWVSIGSDHGVEGWLNGKSLLKTSPLEKLDQAKGMFKLELKPGENQLLLKYTNAAGYYNFYFQKFDGYETERTAKLRSEGNEWALESPVKAAEPLTIKLHATFGRNVKLGKLAAFATNLEGDMLDDLLQTPSEIKQELLSTNPNREKIAAHFRTVTPLLADARARHAALRKELEDFTEANSTSVLVMRELDKPRESFVQERGNFLNHGEPVAGGVPSFLPPLPPGKPANRLSLAEWLVSPENPLTSRVAVNHFWRTIFGLGLVKTSEDFGAQGDLPVHPQLLDWLAVEFMDRGWDMKALVRLLVTSAAYRQSSNVSPELLQKDPENKLLARAPRFRMPAEGVRDLTLAASGLLSAKIGGPSVYPPMPATIYDTVFVEGGFQAWPTSQGEDRYRRGLYTFYKRTGPYPSLVAFDAPERQVCTLERSRSNTPLQALTTLNDEVFVEAAGAMAKRLVASGTAVRDRIDYGFRLVAARHPREKEMNSLLSLFEKAASRYRADQAAAVKLVRASHAGDDVQLAPWIVVSNVLLNLDETVTKE
jgi:cytochrome c556